MTVEKASRQTLSLRKPQYQGLGLRNGNGWQTIMVRKFSGAATVQVNISDICGRYPKFGVAFPNRRVLQYKPMFKRKPQCEHVNAKLVLRL